MTSGQGAKICFPPDARLVGTVVTFIEGFCEVYVKDRDILSRLKLTAHELAENVVKYSDGGLCAVSLSLDHASLHTVVVEIATENSVDESKLESVCSYLDSLEDASDAVLFYDSEIRKSARRPIGSGLGLARIRAEALMALRHETKDNRLLIRASTTLILPKDARD